MKVLFALPALALVVLVLAIGARLTSPHATAPAVRPDTSYVQTTTGYPADVEATFRRDYANLPPAVGACVLRETEARYTYPEFQSMVRQYAGTNTMPPSVQSFVSDCARKYGQ